jgi:hypothetical protein
MFKPTRKHQMSPSLTNIANAFQTSGWTTMTCLTKCVIPGQIGEIFGYEDYYVEDEKGQSLPPLTMEQPCQEAPNLMTSGTQLQVIKRPILLILPVHTQSG